MSLEEERVTGDREKLFDDWAASYDDSVRDDRGFPFEGYEEVLNTIVRLAAPESGMTVLDVGIGTGALAERVVRAGAAVCGMDFSVKMLAKARERLPEVELVKADLRGEWPLATGRRFDRIVSAYVFHEFDPDSKVRLVGRLAERHLAPRGRIVVGDVSFPTAKLLEAERESSEVWDDDEWYWVGESAVPALESAGLRVEYTQISFCGGVYSIERVTEGA
jgi:putative AdoMet-dependent methyltransferase